MTVGVCDAALVPGCAARAAKTKTREPGRSAGADAETRTPEAAAGFFDAGGLSHAS